MNDTDVINAINQIITVHTWEYANLSFKLQKLVLFSPLPEAHHTVPVLHLQHRDKSDWQNVVYTSCVTGGGLDLIVCNLLCLLC